MSDTGEPTGAGAEVAATAVAAEEAAAKKVWKIDYQRLKPAVAQRGAWWMFDSKTDVYEPRFGRDAIDVINRKIDGDSPARLGYDDIGDEKSYPTEQEFLQKIDEMLARDPSVIYQASPFLRYVFSSDEIKQRLVTAGNGQIDHRFLTHFSDYKGVFTPDEQREQLTRLVTQPGEETATGTLILFQDNDALALFPPRTVSGLLIQAAQQSNFSMKGLMDERGGIGTHIREGRLTGKDFYDIVVGRVYSLKDISYVAKYLTYKGVPDDPRERQRIKTAILETYPQKATLENVVGIVGMKDWFTADELQTMVKNAASRREFKFPQDLYTCEELVPQTQLAEIVKEALQNPKVILAPHPDMLNRLLATSLDPADREGFIDALIATGRIDSINNSLQLVNVAITDERKRETIYKALFEGRPVGYKLHRIFDAPRSIQQELLATISGEDVSEAIRRFSWTREQIPSRDIIFTFLERHRDTHADVMLNQIRDIIEFIPHDVRESFLKGLMRQNPLLALLSIERITVPDKFTVTKSEIEEMVAKDPSGYGGFAPRLVIDLYSRFSFAKGPGEQKTLITEARNLQRAIRSLKDDTMGSDFRRILGGEPLSIKQEQELLEFFECFALLKNSDPARYSGVTQSIITYDQAKHVLFEQFAAVLGRSQQLSAAEIDTFYSTMKTPAPFMEYVLQYRDSPEHAILLREIFDHIIVGKFPDWKYGDGSDAAFQSFKSEETPWLPAKLTKEQYAEWRTDGQTTIFETLQASTKRTADAIETYLENNAHYLEIDVWSMDQVERRLSVVERDINDAKETIVQGRRDPTSIEDNVEFWEEVKKDHENHKRKLRRARKILHLMSLKPEEIAAGYFFEGKDGKQRGKSIVSIIEELRESSASANQFVYDEVLSLLDSAQIAETDRQNLTCTDSSDPKIWIEIGDTPVASCQTYRSTSHLNKSLLGYTEPDTKILVATNEKGNLIGRAIFRLLETEDGAPALHVERIYSSYASQAIDKVILARAYAKAQAMGMTLYTSYASQTEQGQIVEFESPDGYRTVQVNGSLHAKAHRAPSVYVDAAAGMKHRDFTLDNLLQVEPVTAAA